MVIRRVTPNWEAATEAAIRESLERGEFDGLTGQGQPIAGLDQPHDELWWVKQKLAAEQIEALPASLRLRRERELTLEAARTARSEAKVRELLDELNGKIRTLNKYGASGPPSTLIPVDVEGFVDRWRRAT